MNEGCIYLYFQLVSPFPVQLHVTAGPEQEQETTLLSLLGIGAQGLEFH